MYEPTLGWFWRKIEQLLCVMNDWRSSALLRLYKIKPADTASSVITTWLRRDWRDTFAGVNERLDVRPRVRFSREFRKFRPRTRPAAGDKTFWGANFLGVKSSVTYMQRFDNVLNTTEIVYFISALKLLLRQNLERSCFLLYCFMRAHGFTNWFLFKGGTNRPAQNSETSFLSLPVNNSIPGSALWSVLLLI